MTVMGCAYNCPFATSNVDGLVLGIDGLGDGACDGREQGGEQSEQQAFTKT